MTLTYTLDSTQRLITILGEYAHPDEWEQLLSRVLHDPRYAPGFAFLRDLRAASAPVDATTVLGIMHVVRGFWPLLRPGRVAVLTPRTVDPAALTAAAIADTENIPLKVFNSYQDAIEWLRGS